VESKIAHWITVGANVAVLAGLLFVAVHIRQNTRSIRAAAYQTWVASATSWNLGIAADKELAAAIVQGHTDAGKLTDVSQMQYAMSMLALMQMIQSTYYLYRDGSIDASLWDIERQRAALHLTNPGVRQWWDAGARTQLSPEFVRIVEATKVTSGSWNWEPGRGFVPLGPVMKR
jgi:hypothetical protein